MRAGKLPVETCLVTTIHDWGVRRSAARNQSKRTDAEWHPRPVGRGRSGGGGGGNRTRVRKPYVPGPTCL